MLTNSYIRHLALRLKHLRRHPRPDRIASKAMAKAAARRATPSYVRLTPFVRGVNWGSASQGTLSTRSGKRSSSRTAPRHPAKPLPRLFASLQIAGMTRATRTPGTLGGDGARPHGAARCVRGPLARSSGLGQQAQEGIPPRALQVAEDPGSRRLGRQAARQPHPALICCGGDCA